MISSTTEVIGAANAAFRSGLDYPKQRQFQLAIRSSVHWKPHYRRAQQFLARPRSLRGRRKASL